MQLFAVAGQSVESRNELEENSIFRPISMEGEADHSNPPGLRCLILGSGGG